MKKVLLTLTLAAFAFAANAQFVVSGQFGFNTNGGKTYQTATVGSTTTEATLPSTVTTNINFIPSIGYKLNDNMQVGLGFGITYNYNKTFNTIYGQAYGPYTDKAEDWTTVWSTDFSVAPYFRYYFMEAGNFNFFCEASVALTINGRDHTHLFATKIDADPANGVIGTPKAIDTTYVGDWNGTAVAGVNSESWTKRGSIAVSVVPGVNYKFNDNFSADLYLDVLGLAFTHSWANYSADFSTSATTLTGKNNSSSNSFRFFGNFNNQTLGAFLGFRLGFNYHF